VQRIPSRATATSLVGALLDDTVTWSKPDLEPHLSAWRLFVGKQLKILI
jgi:hypothetical protein